MNIHHFAKTHPASNYPKKIFFPILAILLTGVSCSGQGESGDATPLPPSKESPRPPLSPSPEEFSSEGYETDTLALNIKKADFIYNGGGEGQRENPFGLGENELCAVIALENRQNSEEVGLTRPPLLMHESGINWVPTTPSVEESGLLDPVPGNSEVSGEVCWYTDSSLENLDHILFRVKNKKGNEKKIKTKLSEIEISVQG